MTNDVLNNQVTMYSRAGTGQIAFVGRFDTGGRGTAGTNDPLQSQNSMVLSKDHRYLLAVNPGTSDLSVFSVSNSGLQLLSVTPSGGGGPISIALHEDLVYVINYVGNYHTAGFRLTAGGTLVGIANSRQPLSTLDAGACTMSFTPDGTKLVVSERIANKIDVFTVNADGSISNPVYNASAGAGPFGLEFTTGGTLLVTETNGGPPNPGTTSSYLVNGDNTLTVVTAKADASGMASCWIRTNDIYAWVSDSATGNIGAFNVGASGQLTPIGSVASGGATAFPFDLGFSGDGKFLYIFYSGTGRIVTYGIRNGATLVALGSASAGVPATGGVGLASY